MAEDRRPKFPLHYYVLKNDVEALENELRRITTEEAARHAAVSSVSTSSSSSSSLAVPPERAAFVPTGINQRDDRGNTAFHLAIHLMRQDMVELFLRYNVDFGVKNGGGWNGLQEAVASGHRDMLDRLMSATQTHIENKLESRLPKALEALSRVPDFRLKMRWEVGTWVPLVSRFCPWDEYEIYKCGSSVRVDTTLIGFDKMQWIRGHVSFLVLPLESDKPGDIILMNHDHKMAEYLFDSFRRQTKERGTATEMLMAPLVRGHVDTESVKFQHIQPSGSWFRSRPKTETIGSWGNCKQYEAENIRIISKKRTDSRVNRNAMRPHPSDAEIETIRNNFCSPRAIKEYFEGNDLPLPPGKKGEGLLYSFEKQQVKVRTQTAKIWFSADFPFSLRQLIPIFEVLAPTGKHFEKLYKFITMQLPDEGFPVKMEIPLFPTITATITFGDMKLETSDPSLFVLPSDYEVLHNASMLFRTNFNDAQAPGDGSDQGPDSHSIFSPSPSPSPSSSSSSSSAPPPENLSDGLDEDLSNDHVS